MYPQTYTSKYSLGIVAEKSRMKIKRGCGIAEEGWKMDRNVSEGDGILQRSTVVDGGLGPGGKGKGLRITVVVAGVANRVCHSSQWPAVIKGLYGDGKVIYQEDRGHGYVGCKRRAREGPSEDHFFSSQDLISASVTKRCTLEQSSLLGTILF